MRLGSVRLPRLLILVGFVGVVAGAIAVMAGSFGASFGSWTVTALALPIGYCLVGLAWWQLWAPGAHGDDPTVMKRMRRFSRTLAAASAVTAIAWFAYLYGNLRFLYSVPGTDYLSHFGLQLAGAAAQANGFLIAALGFWIAGSR
jgi:hypothetical protein